MRIIIVSNSPWRSDNSFGNSFSNIFDGIENIEIANIYCKYGQPQNNCASMYFQITEKSLIKNLIKGSPSGKEVFKEDFNEDALTELNDGVDTFKKFSKHKNQLVKWARAIIWKIGKWKSPELINFVDGFNPDLVFIPIYYSHYIHDINKFILNRFNIPALGYVSDDVYTMKQFSLSPLYWLDRLMLRPKMKKVFSWCKTVYVISETQRREYAKIFGDKFKILTKCADFDDKRKPEFKKPGEILKMTYAGNISHGRYLILSALAKAVKNLNSDGIKFSLDIYTSTPLSEKQTANLNVADASVLHPSVSYKEILEIQKQSDILVHAEAFDLKEKLLTHQSFSTKIVDYLTANRCILAIGDGSCASIQYFIDNGCGAVVADKGEIEPQLRKLYNDKSLLESYASKAWETGKKNHNATVIKNELIKDLKSFSNKED